MTSKERQDYALSVHAHRLCILRVFMSMCLLLLWFVSCLSSVLVLIFMLYLYSFRSQFSVVGGILFTPPVGDSKTALAVTEFYHCNFCTRFIVRLIAQVNRPFTDFRRFPRSISVKSIVAVMSQMRDATRNLACHQDEEKLSTNFGNKLDPLHS